MPRSSLRLLTAGLSAAMLFVVSPTLAQSTDQKPAEKPPASDAKDAQKKIDEFAEAEKLLGGPAANPECLWLGRRGGGRRLWGGAPTTPPPPPLFVPPRRP